MELLKRLHIKKPDYVLTQYGHNHHNLYCLARERENLIKSAMHSSTHKHFDITYCGESFTVWYHRDHLNGIDFAIHPHNITPLEYCIHIMIEHNEEYNKTIAHLITITYRNNYVRLHAIFPGNYDTLFRLALHICRHKKYNVSRISLLDDSMYVCESGSSMNLATLHMLRYGHTWYGCYGFRQSEFDYNVSRFNLELYEKNGWIIRNTKVADTNLPSYIKSLIPHDKVLELYGSMYVIDFINLFIEKIDTDYKLFKTFYLDLYDDLSLRYFDHQHFVMYV